MSHTLPVHREFCIVDDSSEPSSMEIGKIRKFFTFPRRPVRSPIRLPDSVRDSHFRMIKSAQGPVKGLLWLSPCRQAIELNRRPLQPSIIRLPDAKCSRPAYTFRTSRHMSLPGKDGPDILAPPPAPGPFPARPAQIGFVSHNQSSNRLPPTAFGSGNRLHWRYG
jgi:hypothetical protein